MNEPIGDHCPCCGAVEADWNGNYADTDWETMDRLRARVAELEGALHHAEQGVDAALQMVESGKAYIPDWDWLRSIRKHAREVLAKGRAG